MFDNISILRDFKPTKDYLVAIDSDGCVFDSMGIKQRECFCPMMIAYFGLQPVAEAARQCKEFADLFSKTRGSNRHITIAKILKELLPKHPLVLEKDFKIPDFSYYIDWANNPSSILSNKGLKQAIDNAHNSQAKRQLETALIWSQRVDQMVEEIVKNIPPFPYVRQCLEKMQLKADIIVCSQTPTEAIVREWQEHNISKYPAIIAGQELGTKAEHLELVGNGKYDKHNILMIGDAPGDYNAAYKNGVLFYPINPGNEIESWKRLNNEAFDLFLQGKYAGGYQEKLLNEFQNYLPENPHWK
jgi:phosphoglycolate phosphatase-like HAD superfamily hydrolase